MPAALRLDIRDDRLATLTFDLPGKKVNVFTRSALGELEGLIEELGSRDDIGCLVLLSGKPSGAFIAGADVDEIASVTDPAEAEAASRLGQRLFLGWESLPFPTVAAIQGTCLGGGTELALSCDHLLVSDRSGLRIGLPEVRLGILPAWGGCTRLPERIGIAAALDIILAGKTVSGHRARRLGLADALLPDAGFLHHVREFALEHRDGAKRAPREGAGLKEMLLEKNPLGRKVLFDQARKKTLEGTSGHYPAPLRAIEVVRTGAEEGRRQGFDAEARAVAELAISPVAKNLIHVFRLMEGAKRDSGLPGGEAREVRQVGVLGAGAMGGGIAQLIAHETGIPVRLKDIGLDPLTQGMEHAARLFGNLVRKGRLEKRDLGRKMALLRPTLDYTGFARADLVIEAVVEKLGVKQDVFAAVAAATGPEAVLASNTSSLSIHRIGEKTPRRQRVVGMHFFNPVHKMPLVEVIVGERTDAAAVNTVVTFARRLGKTPVIVKDGPGFLVNRLLMFYMAEALWLLQEGHRIEDVDRAMEDWGMPMGPLTLTDEVGIDVAVKVAHILEEAFGDRLPLPGWLDRLADEGRLGAKSAQGFYRYEGKERRGPDPDVYTLLGLRPTVGDPRPGDLADRMVLPMVNEAARCLADGIVRSPADLDLAMILGTGFPPFRGGLCRWADDQGPAELERAMGRLAERAGDRHRPSPAFEAVVAAGGFYARGGAP